MPIIDAYTLLGAWPEAEIDLSVEALAAGMQGRSVSKSLVTHTTAVFYDPALGNQQCAELCSRYEPLLPVAVIDPLRYPACLDEIERSLGRGAKVFRLCPREHGYPLSAAVGPLLEVLEKLASASLLLVDLTNLPAPVISADLPARLPIPTACTVDGASLGTVLCAGRSGPNVWIETSRLEAGGAVEAAVRGLGAGRLIFGSGAPLRSLGSAVMSVQYAEMPEPDRQLIFDGNVAKLLG